MNIKPLRTGRITVLRANFAVYFQRNKLQTIAVQRQCCSFGRIITALKLDFCCDNRPLTIQPEQHLDRFDRVVGWLVVFEPDCHSGVCAHQDIPIDLTQFCRCDLKYPTFQRQWFTNCARKLKTFQFLTASLRVRPRLLIGVYMAAARPRFGIGASALRVEDKAFLTGAGQYTDDLKIADCLYGFVVRSQISAGSFELRNADEIRAMDGVQLVLTAKEIAHLKPLATSYRPDRADGSAFVSRDIPILCSKTVHYSGDAIAFIVADTLEHAEDAAGMFEVDYKQTKTVVDASEAVKPNADLVWPELKSNIAYVSHIGDRDRVRKTFEGASRHVKIVFRQNRLASNYMETRAAVGEWRESEDRFVLTLGSQGVHGIRAKLASDVFGIRHEMLRVVTKDVGGGFGPKAFAYREYALVLEAAKRLGKPVKWVGSRTEHFLTDAHGRDNVVEAEMALDDDGHFLALKVNLIANMGAYLSENAVFVPELGVSMTTGLYDIPAIDVTIANVYTNTCPVMRIAEQGGRKRPI